jgi:RNA polymerase sigma-70 factor (ECF subfamily)
MTESIERLQNESGFLRWAREIARRRILEYRRGRRREQFLDPVLLNRLAEAADRVDRAAPDEEEQRAALAQCLESLPSYSRRLIQMRYDGSVADMNELADRLGRTVHSVYAQVKRIKIALRECVARRLARERVKEPPGSTEH